MSHFLLPTFLLAILISTPLSARDAARDLKKMKGFTIVDSAAVKKIVQEDGKKHVVLDNKTAYRVEFLFLDPLPLTDVIIFAKPPPKELREKYKDLAAEKLYTYKVLIDNEIYDATPVD